MLAVINNGEKVRNIKYNLESRFGMGWGGYHGDYQLCGWVVRLEKFSEILEETLSANRSVLPRHVYLRNRLNFAVDTEWFILRVEISTEITLSSHYEPVIDSFETVLIQLKQISDAFVTRRIHNVAVLFLAPSWLIQFIHSSSFTWWKPLRRKVPCNFAFDARALRCNVAH